MDHLNSPLVSIITPTLNQSEFLEETILSVLNQDYPAIEYLIFDGGSTDNTLELIKKYSQRISYWESTPDRGPAHAINKGIRRATGDYQGWLNSDDLLLPNAIRKIVDAFDRNPEVDVVYGKLVRIDESGVIISTPRLPKDEVTFSKYLVIGECLVNQPGSLWRRGIVDRVGLLDEDLEYAFDYEFWVRIALADAQFFRLPEVLALFRLSPGSKTVSKSAEMAVEQLNVLNDIPKQIYLERELNLTETQIEGRLRTARSVIGLHAFYGCIKQHKFRKAGGWLRYSLSNDFKVMFQRRWTMLAIARLNRIIRFM